jgi:hypothetical protein
MPITVTFRGVGIYVPKNRTVMSEILYPNAEDKPSDHDTDQDGAIGHADKSKATQHFAGVLIHRKNGKPFHRRLFRKRVTFPGAGDTKNHATFGSNFPSLALATNQEPFKLKLLTDRDSDRVATRIILHEGEIEAVRAGDDQPRFAMESPFGTTVAPRRYSFLAKWTTPKSQLTLKVDDLPSGSDTPIELSEEGNFSADFYCFDKPLPSAEELKHNDLSRCEGLLIDDDFKWLFQLLDRQDGTIATWQQWLGPNEFPAPQTDCVVPLVPVFTCFPTYWDGA